MKAERSLNWRPPLEILIGQAIVISIMLVFMFWAVVYVRRNTGSTYSGKPGSIKSNGIRGGFVLRQACCTCPHLQDPHRRYAEDYCQNTLQQTYAPVRMSM
jgi:hypothetical protein